MVSAENCFVFVLFSKRCRCQQIVFCVLLYLVLFARYFAIYHSLPSCFILWTGRLNFLFDVIILEEKMCNLNFSKRSILKLRQEVE
jgi:hypothetical protein